MPRPGNIHVNLEAPKAMVERARAIAKRRGWTLTTYVNNAMRKAIVADEKESEEEDDRDEKKVADRRSTGLGSLREQLRERRVMADRTDEDRDLDDRPQTPVVNVHVNGAGNAANEPPIAYLANIVVNGGPGYSQRERLRHAVEILKGAAAGNADLGLNLTGQLDAEIAKITEAKPTATASWLAGRAKRGGL